MKRFIWILLGIAMICSAAQARNYYHGGEVYYVPSYVRSDGTPVTGHLKTMPDEYKWNNLNQ